MPKDDNDLGGRISLSNPAELTQGQQSLYRTISEGSVPWAESSGFVAKLKDGRLVGPFNVVLQSSEIGAAFMQLQSVEGKSTSLTERVRQVVILTVGSVWKAPYELYAHSAVSPTAGLTGETVAALARGDSSPVLTADEKLAQHFTKQLALEHTVSQELFDQAKGVFGVRGIVDMLFLAGCYDIVCSLLNTFDVPVPGR